MNIQLILAGVGGQGILFATRVFSETALAQGYPVIGSETHGMSQRGGSVISHLKIGPYQSPLVRRGTADMLLSLDRDEAYRNLSFLRPGGMAFVNHERADFMAPAVKRWVSEQGIAVQVFDADRVALDLGAPVVANLVLIGSALSHPQAPFAYTEIRETVARLSSSRFRSVNLEALERGYRGLS